MRGLLAKRQAMYRILVVDVVLAKALTITVPIDPMCGGGRGEDSIVASTQSGAVDAIGEFGCPHSSSHPSSYFYQEATPSACWRNFQRVAYAASLRSPTRLYSSHLDASPKGEWYSPTPNPSNTGSTIIPIDKHSQSEGWGIFQENIHSLGVDSRRGHIIYPIGPPNCTNGSSHPMVLHPKDAIHSTIHYTGIIIPHTLQKIILRVGG